MIILKMQSGTRFDKLDICISADNPRTYYLDNEQRVLL